MGGAGFPRPPRPPLMAVAPEVPGTLGTGKDRLKNSSFLSSQNWVQCSEQGIWGHGADGTDRGVSRLQGPPWGNDLYYVEPTTSVLMKNYKMWTLFEELILSLNLFWVEAISN